MYSLLLAIIYLAFISLGLPDSLLGAGWPAIHESIGAPVASMGVITMVIAGGTVVSSLLSDRLTRRFGARYVTAVSVLLTALALFGFSISNAFWMFIVFSIPYGLGAGAVDAALNNYVALHYAARHMSWLHCMWGVGAIASPFIMGYAIGHETWEWGYGIVGGIQIIITIVLFATLPLWKIHGTDGQSERKSVGITGALRIPGVPSILLGFFAYSVTEATTMAWSATYMVEAKGLTPELAAQFASLFYIGITAGRFIGGFMMGRLGDRRMINIGTVVLLCGIGLLALPTDMPLFALAGFLIIGLGCAPIYPSIIHSTPANFGPEHSGAIIGIQMASAYIGTTFLPPVYGLLGSWVGFGILPAYLAAFALLMICMTEHTFRVTRR